MLPKKVQPETMIVCQNAPGNCTLMAKACLKRRKIACEDDGYRQPFGRQLIVSLTKKLRCHECMTGEIVAKKLKDIEISVPYKTCECGKRFYKPNLCIQYVWAGLDDCLRHRDMSPAERKKDIAEIKKKKEEKKNEIKKK